MMRYIKNIVFIFLILITSDLYAQSYCASSGNTSFNTGVARVVFNTIDNTDNTNDDNAYENFTAITTQVIQGSSYSLSVYCNTAGSYTVNAFAWFDWNDDGDFTDPGETYDLGTAYNVTNGLASLCPMSIAVPGTASLSFVRLRVSVKYASDPTSCETGFDGEVEDYEVEIVSPSPSISVSGAITGLDYCDGFGPSSSQTFTVSGSNLTDDITLTAPTNFEISTDDATFSNSITLTQSGGTVNSTTIYARLVSGLSVASYGASNVTATSTGATIQNVALSGDVTANPITVDAGTNFDITISDPINLDATPSNCGGVTTYINESFSSGTISEGNSTTFISQQAANSTHTGSYGYWRLETTDVASGNPCNTSCGSYRATIASGSPSAGVSTLWIGSFVPETNSISISFNWGYDDRSSDGLDYYQILLASSGGDVTLVNQSGSDALNQTYSNSSVAVTAGETYTLTLKYANSGYSSGIYGASIDNISITENIPCTYAWSGPLSFTSSVEDPQVTASAVGNEAGIYTITVSASGCSAIDNVTVSPACTAPTTAATGLSTAYVSNTSASISYSAPTEGDEIIIVCRPTASAATDPTYGEAYATASLDYSAAPSLGSGKVVYSGVNTDATQTVTNLDCATNYSFDIYSRNSAGDCYNNTEASIDYTTKRLCGLSYVQASSADVAAGATDAELYRINVSVTGTTGNIRLNSIQLTSANDNDNDVAASSVKLYRTSVATFATTNQMSTGQPISGGTVTFNSGTDFPYNFPDGITYLWVAVDVAGGATIGDNLDFSITANSIDIESVTYPSSTENPSGYRTIVATENNGFVFSGNITNTGNWEHYASDESSSPTEYIMVNGSSKSFLGDGGTYTQVWMQIDGDMFFSATNMLGEMEKTIISSTKSLSVTTVSANTDYKTGWFKNNGTLSLDGANSKVVSSGDFINSATISAHINSTVEFVGTVNQNVTSSGAELGGVTFNNSTTGTAITLVDNMTTKGITNFIDGIVLSTPTSMLIQNDGSTTTGANDGSYVSGPVRKIGDDAFTYPVGDADNYQAIGISAPSVITDHFTAQYYESDPDLAGYDDASKDPSLDHISSCEYWILNRTGGASNVEVTLTWDANSCGVTDLANLSVARWDGTTWNDHNQGGGTTGNNSSGTVTSDVVTSFSPFTLGSKTGANPLPIELIVFDGDKHDDFNLLYWKTATEINSDHFELYRSKDGIDFIKVSEVEAAGNSSKERSYDYKDYLFENNSYYQLKLVDFDGQYSLSNIVFIQRAENNEYVSKEGNVQLFAYPNPSAEYLNLSFLSLLDDRYNLKIYDVRGRKVAEENIIMNEGQWNKTINVKKWESGVYYIDVEGQKDRYVTKFVKVL